ncbi:MAG: DUF2161 family putative PD-(D/E)XK-type phosphodiesterase [Thermoanaerobaculia bacterium]|nr:DUF2161 family putative PD-(D/E)XK-type phosphodiesterase [Thermoanaerobaculia bacterium]
MKEADLYPPVKQFLEGQGYEVKGEVGECDVLAVRGDEEPVIVELKLSLGLDVVLQAVDRLTVTPKVYVGVPRRCPPLRRRRRAVRKLLRRLGLGLVAIDPAVSEGAVDVLLDPGEYRPRISRRDRARLLGEFQRRVGDPNQGGADRRGGVMTAYRQRTLRIARHLLEVGPARPADVAAALGEPRARDILYRNVYGWFDRPRRGVYELSPRGHEEIPGWP